jgi:hypothetical protein
MNIGPQQLACSNFVESIAEKESSIDRWLFGSASTYPSMNLSNSSTLDVVVSNLQIR